MASENKVAANQRNAQRSTGPTDTSRSRLNALKHGIFSSETLIRTGEAREEAEVLERLRAQFTEQLEPKGALEQLLVDKVVAAVWRWRRVLRYETELIRTSSNSAVVDWEEAQNETWQRYGDTFGGQAWEPTAQLAEYATTLDQNLQSLHQLDKSDPLEASPHLWVWAVSVAERQFNVSVNNVLRLEGSLKDLTEVSREDANQVVATACRKARMRPEDFWSVVRDAVKAEQEKVHTKLERRRRVIEQLRLSASLPDDKGLEKVQRYETHLSRQFYKALHELQRLQAARHGLRVPLPVALDIDMSSGPGEGNQTTSGG